jgi:dihydrofolate reductase
MYFEYIVAISQNGVIGNNNRIPWNLPEDLQYFKKITNNSIVIMGRKTFDSLPNGPLPNRLNIVLSRKPSTLENLPANVIFTDPDHVLEIIQRNRSENQKVFVIGGNEIYKLFFDRCKMIHVTVIYEAFDGDTVFPYDPDFLMNHGYKNIYKSEVMFSKSNQLPYQFLTFHKVLSGWDL